VRDEAGVTADLRTNDAIFTLSDGTIGVRGDLETGVRARSWLTPPPAFGGVPTAGMVVCPAHRSPRSSRAADVAATRRMLDLRSGVLVCRPLDGGRARRPGSVPRGRDSSPSGRATPISAGRINRSKRRGGGRRQAGGGVHLDEAVWRGM
jgi:hypothetical protein